MDNIKLIDSFYLDVHKQVARRYQEYTGSDKDFLAKGLRFASGGSWAAMALYDNSPVHWFSASQAFIEMTYGVVPEIFGDRKRIHKGMSIVDPLFYPLPYFFCITGLSKIVGGVIGSDYGIVDNGIWLSCFGFATLFHETANYIERTDIRQPPRRKREHLSKRFLERLKQLIPQQQPIPDRLPKASLLFTE